MFALLFRFPCGRYHATPWGRHVNEGAVAWPPEPYRILRALIATWHRKADKTRWSEPALHRLIETLAASAPVYRLPEAVHAHTRHYMPQGSLEGGRERTSLVFDAFYRVDPDAELVAAWPDSTLDADSFALAAHLASLIGYLGRAESIVVARAVDHVEGELPVAPHAPIAPGLTGADVLTPLTAARYAETRPSLLAQNRDKPGSKGRLAFEATVPLALTDALQVETSQLQAMGWSRPPAARLLRYARPEVGPQSPIHRSRPARPDDPSRFSVARFVLAGRPLPPITDAVKIGEVFRRALMARVDEPVPAVLSGRDEAGAPLRDPRHAHAFFLSEDHDEDGFIDHLVLYARPGLDRSVRRAAESLRALWINDRPARGREEEETDIGRREWRVALEGFGTPAQFDNCALLQPSQTWVSVTPYLRPLHLKGGDPLEETCRMIRAECKGRGWHSPQITLDGAGAGRNIRVGGHTRNVLAFHRFRSRRGLTQPDRTGLALRLEFPEGISGPMALGFGCHFGLGLFRAV
ncbi:MAG: type I-U CRISPR-associated protein Cas5/Cas6 [Burkholderiaceae bacterium]|nr:type I-U CRISPR-associated protein Cas5/Cas6 [Burkholderiaceae bacterium]